MSKANYILAFDTETGGMNPDSCDILTAYFTILDSELRVVEELNLKLKPDSGIPIAEAGALEVNKIDLKTHLEDPDTITYSEAKVKLLTMISKYSDKKRNLRPLGQNVYFDLFFIWKHLLTKSEWDVYIDYAVIDTMLICQFLKDSTWLPQDVGKLSILVDYFGLPKREAHEARADVLMTVDVYRAFIKLMESKKENSAKQDLISLLESE